MPARPRTRATPRAFAAVGLAVLLTVALSGCGQAPWLGVAANTRAPSASPTPLPTIRAIVNDLGTGSTSRTLTAGDVTLTVNYWSTLNMGEWSPLANKPISFSLVGTLGTDDGQAAYLSRVSVLAAVSGPNGALPAPAALTDQASVTPGYLIKTPYSYSQTFILPAVDPAATSMTLSFTYELLVQATPTSTAYAKQTATDQLTIALAAGQ